MAQQSKRKWLIGGFAALFAVMLYHTIKGIISTPDFQLHYWGAEEAMIGTDVLYRRAYIYPPTSAILLMPLALLPFGLAIGIWSALRFFFVGLVLKIGTWFAAKEGWSLGPRAGWIALLAMACTIRPILSDSRHAQINIILLGISSLGIWWTFADSRKRQYFGGALIAVAGMLKAPPLILLGIPIINRRWRSMVGAVAGVAAIVLFSLWWYGPEKNAQFWNDYKMTSYDKVLNHPFQNRIISVPELVLHINERAGTTITGPMAQKWWMIEAALAGMIFLGVRLWRSGKKLGVTPFWDWATVSLGMVIISPMTGHHHMVALLPCMLLLGGLFFREGAAQPLYLKILAGAAVLCVFTGNMSPHANLFGSSLPDFTLLLGNLIFFGILCRIQLPEKVKDTGPILTSRQAVLASG